MVAKVMRVCLVVLFALSCTNVAKAIQQRELSQVAGSHLRRRSSDPRRPSAERNSGSDIQGLADGILGRDGGSRTRPGAMISAAMSEQLVTEDIASRLATQIHSALFDMPDNVSFRQLPGMVNTTFNATAAEELQRWWQTFRQQTVGWLNSSSGNETISRLCGLWDEVKQNTSSVYQPLTAGSETAVYSVLTLGCTALHPSFSAKERTRLRERAANLLPNTTATPASQLDISGLGSGSLAEILATVNQAVVSMQGNESSPDILSTPAEPTPL